MIDDAVRKKAEQWAAEQDEDKGVSDCKHLFAPGMCGECGFIAGHAEGRAEGLKEAAGLVCQYCERGVCKHDEVDEFCLASPIHRELARSRGAAEGK